MTQISEAESRIMEALWRKSPLTADQIYRQGRRGQ